MIDKYRGLYMSSDTLLLDDEFESFCTNKIRICNVDPVYLFVIFFTARILLREALQMIKVH